MAETKALAPWYGSNRMLAPHVGKLLDGCEWVGVPFAGGMSELMHIKARTLVVNDLHRHVINLARVCADPLLGPKLYRRLRRLSFHPDELIQAQAACRDREVYTSNRLEWAVDYFVTCWMGLSAKAGTNGEFKGGLSTRWNAGGGDSAVRYRSATRGLITWRRILARANFSTLDVFEFLDKCDDRPKHGIYCDPPFPGPGDKYTHKFSEAEHLKLAGRLSGFRQARVVCRFYDVPLVRELYPEPHWTWTHLVGRKASNDAAPEVLLTNWKEKAAAVPLLDGLEVG